MEELLSETTQFPLSASTLVAHNPLYLNDLRGRKVQLPPVEQPRPIRARPCTNSKRAT